MDNFEILFFALIPCKDFDYYKEINEKELPEYFKKARNGQIKHIQVCCYKNIGLFQSECICSKILEI